MRRRASSRSKKACCRLHRSHRPFHPFPPSRRIEAFESLDEFIEAYKDSGLLEAFNKAAHIADFRATTDKNGNVKPQIAPGAARNLSRLSRAKVGTQGLMKLPK